MMRVDYGCGTESKEGRPISRSLEHSRQEVTAWTRVVTGEEVRIN